MAERFGHDLRGRQVPVTVLRHRPNRRIYIQFRGKLTRSAFTIECFPPYRHLILSHLILSYLTLSHLILSYLILSYLILFHPACLLGGRISGRLLLGHVYDSKARGSSFGVLLSFLVSFLGFPLLSLEPLLGPFGFLWKFLFALSITPTTDPTGVWPSNALNSLCSLGVKPAESRILPPGFADADVTDNPDVKSRPQFPGIEALLIVITESGVGI